MVNSLGATTPLEIAIAVRAAVARLQVAQLRVARIYSGALVTSLDMAREFLPPPLLCPSRPYSSSLFICYSLLFTPIYNYFPVYSPPILSAPRTELPSLVAEPHAPAAILSHALRP